MSSDNSNIGEAHAVGNIKFVFNLTGGGCSFVAKLLSVSGSSNTVLQLLVPYAKGALKILTMDQDPDLLEKHRFVSKEIASALSQEGYETARLILFTEGQDVKKRYGGFACTSELKTSENCMYANVVVSVKVSGTSELLFVWRKGKFVPDQSTPTTSLWQDICGTRQEQEDILSQVLTARIFITGLR